jgi:hypothetical protein
MVLKNRGAKYKNIFNKSPFTIFLLPVIFLMILPPLPSTCTCQEDT